jgi:hypothetical protein
VRRERDEPEEDLVDAVCHYCGHVLTDDEVAEGKDRSGSSRPDRAPRR